MSHFEQAIHESLHSTCMKTQTGAVIVKDGKIMSAGHNLCAPHGCDHGDSVDDCPRMQTKTGAGYDLCKPIHAEVMACLNVRMNRTPEEYARYASHLDWSELDILDAFTEKERNQLNGAELYLVGHYYACNGCQHFLKTLGITTIHFDDTSCAATKARYDQDGIG